MGNISEMDPRGQKRAAETELWCGALSSSRGRGRMRRGRGVVHRRGLKLKRVNSNAASSCDRDKHFEMVRNVLMSQEDEISLSIVTATEGEGECTVGRPLGEHGGECDGLTLSLKMELERVREKNASLTAIVNEYRVRLKNLQKIMNEKELKVMALLCELERSKEEVVRVKCENRLLRQTRGRMLGSAV